MTTLNSVIVIIPALNEAESISQVLGDLPAVGCVILVDNGSTDGTASIAAAAGAMVVHERRRGYGSACLRGLTEVKSLVEKGQRAPEIIAFADADYSDHVDQLPQLLAPIWEGRADLVIGSRVTGDREPGAMPPQSLWGNRLACSLMKWFLGGSYTDLGPLRAIRYISLQRLGMSDRDFGWTVEMQIKALRAKLRIEEIPVPYRRRVGVSKISGTVLGTIRAGSKILYVIAKYAVCYRR